MTKKLINVKKIPDAPVSLSGSDNKALSVKAFTSVLQQDNINILFQNFCQIIGLPVAIIDLKANVLISSPWQSACINFHRKNDTTLARCMESDTVLANQLNEGKPYSIYQCKNGLTDCASPIIVEGEHLANVFVGQFLLQNPDIKFFRKQAIDTGMEVDGYLNAIRNLPIVDEKILPEILSFITQFAQIVSKLTAEKWRAEEATKEVRRYQYQLENLVEERTEQLHSALAKAQKASLAKSRFLANMSHEIRTPLNAILGYSQIMKITENLPTTVHQFIDIINRSGNHLLGMINDILDMSKIESESYKLNETPEDLRDILEDVCSIIKYRSEDKGILFQREISQNLISSAMVDAAKFRQILINLLGNAVKFTTKGNVTLSVNCEKEKGLPSAKTHRLSIQVSDTGRGIPQNKIKTILVPFEQVHLEDQLLDKGTGLGLSIAHTIIKLMEGTLEIESEEGEGTTIRIELPLRECTADLVEASHQEDKIPVEIAPNQKTFRLLIVEDNEVNRELLKILMIRVGFEVFEAGDGAEAITVFQQCKPHFIWTDMRMPVMDGYTMVSKIRKMEGGREVKIVAISASAFESDKKKILESGCDDFTVKPFIIGRLYSLLKKHLKVRFLYSSAD